MNSYTQRMGTAIQQIDMYKEELAHLARVLRENNIPFSFLNPISNLFDEGFDPADQLAMDRNGGGRPMMADSREQR